MILQKNVLKSKFKHAAWSIILVITAVFNAYSQSGKTAIKDVQIHSPNITDLGKYGEYPVNLSTGTTTISVPLFNVRSGKLELPISLSYHSSGIKVDQEATSVGLGWTLHAGGSVSRIIRDVEDQGLYGFLTTGSNLPNINSIEGLVVAGGYADNSTMLQWFNNSKDKEPDLFNMITNNLSAEFSLDNNGKYVSATLDSLDFNVDINNRTIVVKDKKGNIYRFGKSLANADAFEETFTTTQSSGSQKYKQYLSGFYLTEMISADLADTISFQYKTNFYSENRIISSTRHVLNAGGPLSMVDQTGANFEGISHTYLSSSIPNVRIIDKIIFRNGYIQFESIDDRQDISNASVTDPSKARIKGFSVFDKLGAVIQSIVFENNDYFDRTGNGSAIDGFKIPTAQQRKSLKLNAVKFLNKTGAYVNDYQFEYDSTPLPPRNTTSQDFWGYYNGKGNQTIIPKTFYSNSFTGTPEYYGDNRSTDFNFMKAASIRKIKFPTGGYNIYEYEPNYFLLPEQSQNQVEQDTHVSLLAVDKLTTCDPRYMAGATSSSSVEFTVDQPLSNNGTANLYVMFSDFLVSNGQKMTFRLTDLTNYTVYDFERTMSSNHQPLVFNQSITLQQGRTYRLEANTNGVKGSNLSMCNSPYIQAGITYRRWVSSSANQVSPKQAGGLRIKSISSFDNDVMITKKSYEYGEVGYGVNNVGVGSLITDPSKNYYNYPLLYADIPTSASLRNVLWFTSDSQIELGQNSGNPVSYAKVTEKQLNSLDQSLNGKTEYYFDNVTRFSEPRSSAYFPYEFSSFPTWGATANLIKTKIYLQSGQSYVPLQTIEYTYGQTVEKRIKILRNWEVEPDVYAGSNLSGGWMYLKDNPQRFYRYNYFISRGKKLKTKEVIRNYVGGIQSDTTARTFQYNPYYELKKVSYANSKSEIVEVNHKYSSDLDYHTLKAKNIVSLPVQTEEITSGKVSNGLINRYNDDGLLTSTYKALVGNTSATYTSANTIPAYYELDKTLGYDLSSKNIKSVKAESAAPTLFLWSYHNMYPIAEIKGADYAVVDGSIGAAAITSFSRKANPSKTDIDTFLAPLKTALPNALITSYTYSPLIGMSSQTDPKGMTTYYDYDSFGRLQNIKDQNSNIIKNYAYNYGNSETVAPITTHQSQKRSEPFIKNNCPAGQNGTSVTYTVEAGKYSSTISPADADAKALSDIYANGQKNANLLGGCSITIPPALFHNAAKTGYRTKNNCASGESSTEVAYIVPANTYSASTQAAADQLALDDIAANAQKYANDNGACITGPAPVTYYNTMLTIPSIKSNCAIGLNGSPVNYTVPAGRYSSTVSQVEADRQAMEEVTANGQEYANNYGGCSTAPPGSFNFVVSTPVPSMFKVIFNFASNGGSNEYLIGGQNITILAPGSGTGSVTIIDLGVQPSTYTFNLNGAVISGAGATFNNVSFSGSVTLTAQRTSDYYYYSQQRSGQAKKTCPSGQTGNWVTYTVPAGKYTSLISQVDASQKAQNDVNANVQSYANSNGGCALNLSINYNTPASSTSSIIIYNSTYGGQQSYPVSGSGTLTNISPGTVTITATPTPIEGVTHSYSFGGHTPAINSQYAAFGPLTLTSGMTLNITSNQVFKNASLTVSRVKNNCAIGQGGSIVNYTVAANKYSSTVSQADADAQAQADVIINAQAFANENGTCTGVFWNKIASVSVTKNNCPAAQASAPITYTVAAGTYSSSSQEAADQQAQNDLAANAQTYANTNGVCSIIYNSSIATRTLARNNCPAGQNGGNATYTVTAGKHKSLISQADADAKAQADLDANAQIWANSYGTCTTPTVYYNVYKGVSKTKNNCPAGQISNPVTYFVTQSTYSSTISQADADAKAQADLDANAQNYANANGTCVLAPATISYSLPAKQYVVTITNASTAVATTHTISGTGSIPNITSASYTVYIEPVEFDGVSYVFTLGNSAPITSEYASFGPLVLTGNVILNVSLPAAVYYNVAMSVTKTRNNCAVGEVGTSVTYNVAASTYSSTVSQAAANALAQANLDANAQNYANTNGTCNPPVTYYSVAKSIVKTRNNCTAGQTGTSVTYTSAAGKHTSIISQADADAKAQADLDANAQAYANTNGTCTAGTVYWNTTQNSAPLKRNNCPVGQTGGSSVSYSVPAHTYSSTVSQADANAQAVADISANAQNHANANGTCISSTFSINYTIPAGTQFRITVTNSNTGIATNYTTSGTTGTISGIPIGLGYINALELNGTVGYYYNLDGTVYGTSQSGQFVATKSSSAGFGPMGFAGVKVLTITEEEE